MRFKCLALLMQGQNGRHRLAERRSEVAGCGLRSSELQEK